MPTSWKGVQHDLFWQPPKERSRARHRIRRLPPSLKCFPLCNPKGMGITNTISRAELAAISAAVTHDYSHIATDSSLTSLHQTKKQLSHPNLHRHHIQGDVLQSIAKAIRQSPSPIPSSKQSPMPVLSVIMYEHANAFAKKSATTYSDVAEINSWHPAWERGNLWTRRGDIGRERWHQQFLPSLKWGRFICLYRFYRPGWSAPGQRTHQLCLL